MTDPAARTFNEDFRRFFLRGLVVLLPTVLTLWIVVKAYQFIDTAIAEPINRGLRTTVAASALVRDPLPDWLEPDAAAVDHELSKLAPDKRTDRARGAIRSELLAANISTWWKERWYMDVIGLVVAIIAVYIAGRLLGGFFGRRLYRRLEVLITTVPIFKHVYPYVKQIVDFLFSDDQPIKFNRVVVVEYPRKGIWSVGFLTGDTLRSIAEQSGDSVTIFIPSSPTPFTGYTITVNRAEVRELPISVEEAIRFAVSGGVLVPDRESIRRLPGGEEAADPDEARPDLKSVGTEPHGREPRAKTGDAVHPDAV